MHSSVHTVAGRVLVLECQCKPKTNGCGRTQRAILAYLATAPAGFSGTRVWAADGTLTEHGPPYAVPVATVAREVYGTDSPTAAQTRTVQHAVRVLERRGLVWCRHGWRGVREDGKPVSALYVALVWDCAHTDGGGG